MVFINTIGMVPSMVIKLPTTEFITQAPLQMVHSMLPSSHTSIICKLIITLLQIIQVIIISLEYMPIHIILVRIL